MSKPGRKPRVSDEEILAVFQQLDDPVVKTSEIADRVSIGRRTLHDRLTRLEADKRLRSKDVGARGKVWWLPAGDSLPPGGDFSAFIGVNSGVTVEDLYELREESTEADRERWERIEAAGKNNG